MLSASTVLPTPFEGRLDAAAFIDRTPADATCKGMFFTDVLVAARRVGGKDVHARLVAAFGNRYLAFRDYPLREHMALTAMAVPLMYPQLSEREGMRRLGWQVYEGFRQTTIGRVVFSALGIDLESVLAAGPRAFQVCLSHGRASAERVGPGHWR